MPRGNNIDGDHLQLAPYTSVNMTAAAAAGQQETNHTRSPMQRAVEAGCEAPMLDTQYRMQPSICAPVSSLFYQGQLKSADGLAASR